MAHFYGMTQGFRGAASRLGGKESGLTTTAASWSGAIRVELRHDAATGKDKFVVTQTPWHGCGVSEIIASGTIGEPAPCPSQEREPMTTYTIDNRPTLLEKGDLVVFELKGETLEYEVHLAHLDRAEGSNDRVFKLLAVSPEDLAMDAYGYLDTLSGRWPYFRREDFAAATRLVNKLFERIQGMNDLGLGSDECAAPAPTRAERIAELRERGTKTDGENRAIAKAESL